MKSIPIYKYGRYVLKSVCFAVTLQARVVFQETLLQLRVMEHMCPLSGGRHLLLLAFETTPAPRDNWALKRGWRGDPPGVRLRVCVSERIS